MSDSASSDFDSPPAYTHAPPGYAHAAAKGATTHRLIRRSRWSSKAYIQAEGVDRYCFAPAKGRDVSVAIYAGASTANEALGFLEFPTTHNAFRLKFRGHSDDDRMSTFTDVKSRIGYPHSSSFSMKSAISGRLREYSWVNRHPGRETKPVVYDLLVSDLHKLRIATLTVEKKATTISWTTQPTTARASLPRPRRNRRHFQALEQGLPPR